MKEKITSLVNKVFGFVKNKIDSIRDKSGNKQIVHLTYLFTFIFVALIVYLSLFLAFDRDKFINNSYNPREEIFASKVVRGSLYSRDGDVLAYTDKVEDKEYRRYPYSNAFAHVIGYNTKGKQGMELSDSFTLLTSSMLITEKLENEATGNKNLGDNIISTLDLETQLEAYYAMSNYRGAVVVMNAKTGEIIALVSKPDFDPNHINEDWETINSDSSSSVLLNRATQGLYPPGSTFKIVTALEYINENSGYNGYEFDCKGTFEYKGSVINCYHGSSHGDVDFEKSFAKSCNSSFANITTTLNKGGFANMCNDLLFGQELPCPINVKKSFVPINTKSSVDELMQTGIGQGKTQVTPYHMCLISAAIANNGVLMKPYLINRVENANGDVIKTTKPQEYKRLISQENATYLHDLMRDVVLSGTASRIKDADNYIAYGKTGSAEYSSDKTLSHAWFSGFAEGDNGEVIAISVIVENGGSGGEIAVPIAKRVFNTYFAQ